MGTWRVYVSAILQKNVNVLSGQMDQCLLGIRHGILQGSAAQTPATADCELDRYAKFIADTTRQLNEMQEAMSTLRNVNEYLFGSSVFDPLKSKKLSKN